MQRHCLPTFKLVTLRQERKVLAIAFSPDGETIASAGGDQSIKLWDLDSGKVLHTLAGHSGWIWSIAISPDGETLVSGGDDNTSESGELPVKSVV